MERLIRSPPGDVHVLLLEGTSLGRSSSVHPALTEAAVEEAALRVFSRTDGLVLCFFSPQNVDRLVSLFRAASVRGGRLSTTSTQPASRERLAGLRRSPEPEWAEVRVYVPRAQRRKVIATSQFERIDSIRRARIFTEELAGRPDQFAMLFRPSMGPELERARSLEGAQAIWSQWAGDPDGPDGREDKGLASEPRHSARDHPLVGTRNGR